MILFSQFSVLVNVCIWLHVNVINVVFWCHAGSCSCVWVLVCGLVLLLDL